MQHDSLHKRDIFLLHFCTLRGSAVASSILYTVIGPNAFVWADVEDKFDLIPLNNIQKLHKMIFKALCKKWESAEVVLLFMQLNMSAVDNIIGQFS